MYIIYTPQCKQYDPKTVALQCYIFLIECVDMATGVPMNS